MATTDVALQIRPVAPTLGASVRGIDVRTIDDATFELVREAFKALIERESARRLALLGGSEPDLEIPARRRANMK
jgi:hypothetical protein